MNQNLIQQRLNAALASKGISSNSIYNKIIDIIKQNSLSGDCLDFGAGIGNLIEILKELNCFQSLAGADIIERPERLNSDVKWYTCDLNEKLPIPDSTFDVIISSEVIEHLENPRAVAREWFRLLRNKGTLVFTTPNNESWRALLALIFQGHFVAFSDSCYPAHITALLRKDIQRILKEVGFVNERFVFTDIGSIPKMPQINYQDIFIFKQLKGVRFSDNLLVIAHKSS